MDWQKAYYYLICLAALFILFWGLVDLSSTVSGAVFNRPLDQPALLATDKEGERLLDSYYQKRIFTDRLVDSLARVVVAGLVFGYSRRRVAKLERPA